MGACQGGPALIDNDKRCWPCPHGGLPLADAELKARFKDALANGLGSLMQVCADFRRKCPDVRHKIDMWRECQGPGPCDGGALPICEPPPDLGGDRRPTPNLGRQFSCLTAGKPEVEMMKICALFKEHCRHPLDQEWLDGRPRCNMRIPRHDGRLDYITREKFEHAVR